jgi:hypothetical protein
MLTNYTVASLLVFLNSAYLLLNRAQICKRLSQGIDSPGWESIPGLLKRFANTGSADLRGTRLRPRQGRTEDHLSSDHLFYDREREKQCTVVFAFIVTAEAASITQSFANSPFLAFLWHYQIMCLFPYHPFIHISETKLMEKFCNFLQ